MAGACRSRARASPSTSASRSPETAIPGPANEVAFKGQVTVEGHTSLTAADLGTVAPWSQQTAHLVHAGHETVVG